jgi:N-acetylmuramoyl-L-alanine amidase
MSELPRTRSVELRGKVLAGGKTLQLEGKHFAIAAALWVVALTPALSRAAESSGPDRFDTVVVDAGHGGDDVGARGAEGLLEKELVLDIAHRLAKRLSGNGLKVVLTRRDDTFVPLEERTSIANDARADLFISIHANATHDTQVRGIETFFLSLDASDDHAGQVARRENQAFHANDAPAKRSDDALVAIIGDLITNEHMEESNEFARLAQLELAGDPQVARGVKQAPFVVLEGVQMPAALVEIGFLTNRLDEQSLRGTEERDRIVAALVRAALEFGRRYDARRGVGSR